MSPALGVPDATQGAPCLLWGLECSPGGPGRRPGVLTSVLETGVPPWESQTPPRWVPTSALGAGDLFWGSRTPPRSLHLCSGGWRPALGVPDAAQESPLLLWGWRPALGGPGRRPGGSPRLPWGLESSPGGPPHLALGAWVQPQASWTPPRSPHVWPGGWNPVLGVPDATQGAPCLLWGLECSPGGPGHRPGVLTSALEIGIPPWESQTPPRIFGGLGSRAGRDRPSPRLKILPTFVQKRKRDRQQRSCPFTQNVQAAAEAPVRGGGRAREPRVTAWTFPERRGPRNGRGRRVSVWAPVPVPSGAGSPGPRARGRSSREPTAGIHSTCFCE
ncbi:uncharacterized protein [Macaca fascicularis]|uniref:uncharacterized protein n=1 Tax=Macaca fascicularis TaxID=9541 RepID=UPI0032B07394